MATSKFINYFSYTNLYNANSVVNCGINPNTGIIHFFNKEGPVHFTKNAKIKFILNFEDQGEGRQEIKDASLANITKDKNNVYTFSAEEFPKDQRDFQYYDFLFFQIIISEGDQKRSSITFYKTGDILEDVLKEQGYNNIYFQFSYDVNDVNCKQFNNCILHIGQAINSNITYTKWISPIACGNDIKPYIKDATKFVGDVSKCIKATSSSTWTSAFRKSGNTTLNGNYIGNMKSKPSKDYVNKNLVRFQDIDLTTIKASITSIPGTPGTPGTPVTPKA